MNSIKFLVSSALMDRIMTGFVIISLVELSIIIFTVFVTGKELKKEKNTDTECLDNDGKEYNDINN